MLCEWRHGNENMVLIHKKLIFKRREQPENFTSPTSWNARLSDRDNSDQSNWEKSSAQARHCQRGLLRSMALEHTNTCMLGGWEVSWKDKDSPRNRLTAPPPSKVVGLSISSSVLLLVWLLSELEKFNLCVGIWPFKIHWIFSNLSAAKLAH